MAIHSIGSSAIGICCVIIVGATVMVQSAVLVAIIMQHSQLHVCRLTK